MLVLLSLLLVTDPLCPTSLPGTSAVSVNVNFGNMSSIGGGQFKKVEKLLLSFYSSQYSLKESFQIDCSQNFEGCHNRRDL